MIDQLIKRTRTELRRAVQRIVPGMWSSKSPALHLRSPLWIDYGRMREKMYAGTVYLPREQDGMLPEVYRLIQRLPDNGRWQPIVGYFNPVRQIVDFYSNAFGGRFGSDIKISNTVKGDQEIHPDLKPLLEMIWRWSNLDAKAAEYTTLGANQGSVGIRIVNDGGRVFLDFDDRRIIRHADIDTRGNVSAVILKYEQEQFDAEGNPAARVTVDELISKDEFSLKVDGRETLPDDQRENALGVCPYVLVKHSIAPGEIFGHHAYHGSEPVIHGINYALNQLDESTLAHVYPTIFMTSPAQGTPSRIKFGRNSIVYAQTRPGDPAPTMDMMTPNLDTKGTVDFVAQRADWLADRQPQMALSSMGLLSGLSGETLAQVLKPAEAESLRARVVYENGIERAMQLAISVGIFNRVKGFDLGTGTGTAEAAGRAFDEGDGPEAFDFEPRPALPQTSYQRVQQAQAAQADDTAKVSLGNGMKALGIPNESIWRDVLGFDDEKIAALKETIARQDVGETDPPEADANA